MAYFNISDTMNAFLTSRSAAYQEDRSIIRAIRNTYTVTDDKPNYLDLIWDDGKAFVSYITQARYEKAYESWQADRTLPRPDYYGSKGLRVKTKPARIVKHYMNTEDGRANDVFAQAAQAFMARIFDGNTEIHLLKGELIGKWYSQQLYCSCEETGMHSSCMRYPTYNREKRFEIYKDNAEMAVILCDDCGKLVSRAIVWTDRDNGNKFVDRIYGNEMNMKIVQAWAQENGYYTIWGNQKQGSVPENRIALLRTDYRGGGWHPYLDSGSRCSYCNHLYFETHTCARHNHVWTRPVMEWEHDQDVPEVNYGTCQHCGEDRYMDEDGDIVCESSGYCSWCDGHHCSDNRCYLTCEHCERDYAEDDRCPNWVYCDCGEGYCSREHDVCPNAVLCDDCEEYEGCGTCDVCNTRCDWCHSWRPVDQDVCTVCSIKCECCDTTKRISYLSNGRCNICFSILVPARHTAERDHSALAQQDIRYILSGMRQWQAEEGNAYTSVTRRIDDAYYDTSARGTLNEIYLGNNAAIHYLIDQHHIAPYTVLIPMNVRHDLWVQNNEGA